MARLSFVSELPGSGSTFLAAILRQNPAFHEGMGGCRCGSPPRWTDSGLRTASMEAGILS
jgi:hypothetical protein